MATRSYLPRVGDVVRVKSTLITRTCGVTVTVPSWGNKADCVAWPGELGIVTEYQGGPAGDQWTGHRIEFARGRNFHLMTSDQGTPEYYRPEDGESFARMTRREVQDVGGCPTGECEGMGAQTCEGRNNLIK